MEAAAHVLSDLDCEVRASDKVDAELQLSRMSQLSCVLSGISFFQAEYAYQEGDGSG